MPTKCDSEPLPGAEPNTASPWGSARCHSTSCLRLVAPVFGPVAIATSNAEMPQIGVKSATGS